LPYWLYSYNGRAVVPTGMSFFFFISSKNYADFSLSSMCLVGYMPAVFNQSIRSWYARIISPDVLFFMGSTNIASLSLSAITMTYWFPLLDFLGKRPI
jgi:hypothetical protein